MAYVPFQKKAKINFGLVDTTGTTTTTTPYLSMANAHGAFVLFICGTIAADVVCTLRQGTTVGDPAGTEKQLGTKSVTFDGTTGDDSVEILEIDASELDQVNGYMSVAGRTAAAGAAEVMAIVVRIPLRVEPASLVT